MSVLNILATDSNLVITTVREAAAYVIHTAPVAAVFLADVGRHVVLAILSVAHASAEGIHKTDWPFTLCGAAAGLHACKGYLAWMGGKLDHACEHATHFFASVLMAVAHLLG